VEARAMSRSVLSWRLGNRLSGKGYFTAEYAERRRERTKEQGPRSFLPSAVLIFLGALGATAVEIWLFVHARRRTQENSRGTFLNVWLQRLTGGLKAEDAGRAGVKICQSEFLKVSYWQEWEGYER
jgi:hypothetical protein